MPYKNESDTKSTQFTARGGSYAAPNFYSGWFDSSKVRTQYGYRSEGELRSAQEAAASDEARFGNWASQQRVIAAMTRIQQAMDAPYVRSRDFLPCHERSYTVREEQAAHPTVNFGFFGTNYYTATPELRTSVAAGIIPSDGQLRAVGANMMRSSRPTTPAANLTQWFGELRQFGGMFSGVNSTFRPDVALAPGNVGELARYREAGRTIGSGYIAGQFAWIPFFGEVYNSLVALANADKIIDQFLRDSAKLVYRKRTKQAYDAAVTFTGDIVGDGSPTNLALSTVHNVLDGVSIQHSMKKSLGLPQFRARYSTTVTRQDEYRTSNLWEYFAADPGGWLENIVKYNQQARLILGDPLMSYSTIWELIPWSWFADWTWNFGSFLSFQESVAEDSLASRRSSCLYESRITATTKWELYYGSIPMDPGVTPFTTSGNTFSTVDLTQQRRISGSPYDMGIDWSGFSSQKWFILGALGLSVGPGVKLK